MTAELLREIHMVLQLSDPNFIKEIILLRRIKRVLSRYGTEEKVSV